jgi:hypothetical protein
LNGPASRLDNLRNSRLLRFLRSATLHPWLTPLVTVAAVFGYLLVLQEIHQRFFVEPWFDLVLLGTVFALEFAVSLVADAPVHRPRLGWRWVLGLIGRCLAWTAVFVILVISIPMAGDLKPHLRWMSRSALLLAGLVFRGEGLTSVLLLAVDVMLYGLLCVRRGRWRFLVCLVLPVIQVLYLCQDIYRYGGRGYAERDRIEAQAGVRVIFDTGVLFLDRPQHPRRIHFDDRTQALTAVFGCTYCDFYARPDPSFIRFDLASGTAAGFASTNVRLVDIDDQAGQIWFAPWVRQWEPATVLRLDSRSLEPAGRHRFQSGLLQWQPTAVLGIDDLLYMTNDGVPALVVVDPARDSVRQVVNFQEMGLVDEGGTLLDLAVDSRTRRLLIVGGPGQNLLSFDLATREIAATRAYFDIAGTSMAIDEEARRGYYQSGALDVIHAFDLDSLEETGQLPGEFNARDLQLDVRRNRLYVCGFFSGRVIAIDLATGRRVWERAVGGLPGGLALDARADRLWANSVAGFVEIDLQAIDAAEASSR